MSCDELRPLVSALVDGELDREESEHVRAHIAACASCRALHDDLAATSALVRKHASPPRMSELDWARIERVLTAPQAPRRRIDWQGFLGAAALVGLTWGLGALLVLRDPVIVLAVPRPVLPVLAYSDPVFAVAKLPPCPKNLVGVEDASAASGLSKPQLEALERDGLVQVPGTETSLASFYGRKEALVTADAALLVFGGAVSRAVLEVEREHLAPALRATLADLDTKLRGFEEIPSTEDFKRSARLARRVVSVARALDGVGKTPTDPTVLADVAKALNATGHSRSEVLDREIDWSRFVPRGPLRELGAHFRTVVWLGEASFRLDEKHPDELRAAGLIGLALASERQALSRFLDLDDAASLIHGPQDDLGAFDLLSVLRGGIGDAVRPELLARDEALAPLARRAREIARSSRTGALGALEGEEPRFQLMGNARSLEEVVLTELSSPRLEQRPRPTSLDLLAALGSSGARAIAGSDGAPGYFSALEKLSSLLEDVTKVPRAVARAGSGVERSRLFAIAKLVEPTPAGGPSFMETQAYSDRRLLVALAALTVPEPGPEQGDLTYDPVAPLPAVEPLPGFYARLAHGARRLALGLESATPGASRATSRLHRVSDLLAGLALASRETLEGRELSDESKHALRSFASAARVFAPGSAFATEDVHVLVKADGSREWLERTNGPLDRVYMVLPGEKPRLACGPALAARESVEKAPLTARDAASAPRVDPSWASHIVR